MMPNTGDSLLFAIVILLVLLVAVLIMIVAIKKGRSSKPKKIKYPF